MIQDDTNGDYAYLELPPGSEGKTLNELFASGDFQLIHLIEQKLDRSPNAKIHIFILSGGILTEVFHYWRFFFVEYLLWFKKRKLIVGSQNRSW